MQMHLCFFVSDLHGKTSRYESLISEILREKPSIVLLGGDLLPHAAIRSQGKMNAEDFALDYLPKKFRNLKEKMGQDYPEILLILGNDDPRYLEAEFLKAENQGLWHYLHMRSQVISGFTFMGYSMVPPTPFQIKDWERYDVSRFVDPGCVPPTEGFRTVEPDADIEYITIQKELQLLTEDVDQSHIVWLFHTPPYECKLDRAALDGIMTESVPLDVHVGSIAVKRFIEERQPYLTLHGHVHESTRLTGAWQQRFGNTLSFNAAHDGPELAIVSFYLEQPENAVRFLR